MWGSLFHGIGQEKYSMTNVEKDIQITTNLLGMAFIITGEAFLGAV